MKIKEASLEAVEQVFARRDPLCATCRHFDLPRGRKQECGVILGRAPLSDCPALQNNKDRDYDDPLQVPF